MRPHEEECHRQVFEVFVAYTQNIEMNNDLFQTYYINLTITY